MRTDPNRPAIGACVQLVAGGYTMTVAAHSRLADETVLCLWHDSDGRLQEEWIDHRALRAAPDRPMGFEGPAA